MDYCQHDGDALDRAAAARSISMTCQLAACDLRMHSLSRQEAGTHVAPINPLRHLRVFVFFLKTFFAGGARRCMIAAAQSKV